MTDSRDAFALRGDFLVFAGYGLIQSTTDNLFFAFSGEREQLVQFLNPITGSIILFATWACVASLLGGYEQARTRAPPFEALLWTAKSGALAVTALAAILVLRAQLLHLDLFAGDDLSFATAILPLTCTWRFVLATYAPR